MFGPLNRWLFETDLNYTPRWRASLHSWLRLLAASLREVRDGELDVRAASLVYTTLLSFVPLLAFAFAIMKGFGRHNDLQPLLLRFLEPFGDQGVDMALRIMEFVDNVKVGVLGSIGLVLLVYTFVSVMQKIEKSINHVWRVTESRPILQRSGQYFTLLVVGPILMFSSVGLTASIMSSEQAGTLARTQALGPLISLVGWVIPYLLIVAAFTFVYLFMVSARVRPLSALVGGLVGGALWKVAGWVFASFIVTSAQYTAVYSAFATLILFMLWLYWSWFVLMFGAAVAFYHQHPEAQVAPRGAFRLSARMKEQLGLEVARLIGENFYAGLPPWQPHTLSERLGMPEEGVRWALDALQRVGLVAPAGADSHSWVPARDFEGVPMKEVLDALRAADEDPRVGTHAIVTSEVLEAALRRKERAVASTFKGVTLRDMSFAEPEPLPGTTPDLGGEDELPLPVAVRREA